MNKPARHPHEIQVIDVYSNQILVNATDDFLLLVTSRFNKKILINVHVDTMTEEVIQLHAGKILVEPLNMTKPQLFLRVVLEKCCSFKVKLFWMYE